MKLILTPAPIAEYCFLQEALMWVGFNRYPEGALSHDGEDIRFFHDAQDSDKAEPPLEFPNLISSAEASRMGLPRNPEWDGLFGDFDESSGRNPLPYEEQLAAESAWNALYKDYIEVHQAKLFITLKEGKIEAIGRPFPKDSQESILKYEHEPIPTGTWSQPAIDWEASSLACDILTYYHICLNVEQMLDAFPEPEPDETRQIGLVAGQYMLNDEWSSIPAKRSNGGRKRFDWDSFYQEVVARILRGDIPHKQESFIQAMLEWTKKEWGHEAGRSTLLQRLSPIHKLVIKKSQK